MALGAAQDSVTQAQRQQGPWAKARWVLSGATGLSGYL